MTRRSLMLNHPTLDQIHQLGLAGMARAFTELHANPETPSLSHAEWLGLLLDREITVRRDKRLSTRLRHARLRHDAAIEDVDYRSARGLDRALFQKLIQGEWIDAHDNLVLSGPTGSENRGWPVPSVTRHVAMTGPCSISAPPNSSQNSRSPAPKGVTAG
ncbi:unnamed protein product [Acidocella sp. C78]|nr:unnamed protein product [Acidocella sp. C78]